MYLTNDAIDAYSIAVVAGAPFAHLLFRSFLAWPLIFILFTLPASNLLINLGYVSGSGPVLTFARIAPIAAGIGWALTWLVGERLFARSLIAAQNVVYVLASLRSRLDWALECGHKYNDDRCTDFRKVNVSHGEAQHQPDNNWPAQQFNRFAVRGVAYEKNLTVWVPNAWYFPDPQAINGFSFEFPAFSLSLAHIIVWTSLYLIVTRYRGSPGWFISRFCLIFPTVLFALLVIVLTFLGLSFSSNGEREVSSGDVEKYPFVYFSQIHGFFHTMVSLMDYSSAFTGILIFASSRVRSGDIPINPVILLIAQVFPPLLLYLLRDGCNGHLAKVQPAYESYVGTDATFMFDTAAVCFATISGGPLWAFLYYIANFFYGCIGPMVVFLLFIYNSFLEQFPFIERFSKHFIALICSVFAATGLVLCMPTGTSFTTLLQYVSHSSITQLILFIVVVFLYGWHNLDADIRLMIGTSDRSVLSVLLGATSPFYTALLFTSIPAFLAAKMVSVFDLLLNGLDILKHIDYGTTFMTSSKFINHLVGYGILFAPTLIITAFAIAALYIHVIVYRMSWSTTLDATPDWISHTSLRQTTTPSPPPISHRLISSLTKISYRSVPFVIFVLESVFGMILLTMFIGNAVYTRIHGTSSLAAAGNFRTLLLLAFLTFHALALIDIWLLMKRWDHWSRLNLYIAVATMEVAFLNGYMLVASISNTWGMNYQPMLVIFVNTCVRGAMIAVAIAVRWSMAETSHPTRTRDATEIYDATADLDADVDHEDDAPIIYEMRRDVFT